MFHRTVRVAIITGHKWGDREPESYEKQAQAYCKQVTGSSNEHLTFESKVFSGETARTEALDWVAERSDGGAIVFLSRSALREAEETLQTLISNRLHKRKRIRVWVFTGLLFEDRVNVMDIAMFNPEDWKHVVG